MHICRVRGYLCLAGLLLTTGLEAQPLQIETITITRDAQGRAGATTLGINAASFHPSQVLVRFRGGRPQDLLPGSGPPRRFPLDANLLVVPTPPGLSVAETVGRYRTNPNVAYAEPDYTVQIVADAVPTDPRWAEQWDMSKIAAPTAWGAGATDASNVVVAVIDTGIDYNHPDLVANRWTDPQDPTSFGFTVMNGIVTKGGWDDHGHGTHVAGTIGAQANNGIGIAGLNWQVKLLPLKFLNSGGSGQISDAVLAFQKVQQLRSQGVNIRLTNNSWGGGGFSQALKDAMSLAGTVNVCAAGNNNSGTGMYPAAYDNTDIISVLATDQNDLGASFTNYSLAIVDIAAPGVSTLSTVPTGACSLCDPTGYKLLSGTSMASPHVAGVMAALLHKYPALTPQQARDLILDPASYDTLTDAKAKTTSTGGRLNFAKALTNTYAQAQANHFPTLAMGPDVTASTGASVNLTATVADDDGDTLRTSWTKSVSTGEQWLMGWMLNYKYPNATGPSTSFPAPFQNRVTTIPYRFEVADGQGGGAAGSQLVTVLPSPNPTAPPSRTLTVSPLSSPTSPTLVTVGYPAGSGEVSPVVYEVRYSGLNGSGATCCFSGSSVGFNLSTGSWRLRTQAIDGNMGISNSPSEVVRIGGATGTPPLAVAVLDKLSGPAPLTVNIDTSQSSDPDAGGFIQNYFYICGGGFTPGSNSPLGSCTYSTPGTYWLQIMIQDNTGLTDLLSFYIVVTPPGGGGGGGDLTPPQVNFTSPPQGANVAGIVDLSADASDASGIAKVEFFLDAANGTLLGTDTVAPYSVPWDAGTASLGQHTIYATATDTKGNATTASRSVTVVAPTSPQVVITSPTNGSTVNAKANVTILANATVGTYPINRVEFRVGTSLVCSDTTSPYSCGWRVPNSKNKSYQLKATIVDIKGASTSSATVNVTSK